MLFNELLIYLFTAVVAALGGYFFATVRRKPFVQQEPAASSLSSSTDLSSSSLPLSAAEVLPRFKRIQSHIELQEGGERRQLIVVAKQLPIKAYKKDGEWHIEWEDSRSFLANLRTLRSKMDVKWVGSPGVFVPREEQADFETLLEQHNCVPVFLVPELHTRFFDGFCKKVLWPLLHYVLPQAHAEMATNFDDVWQAYQNANMLYANHVARVAESPTDTIWVQNYHLLLVPSFLRQKLPHTKIGLFVHTPFPSSDVFRILPTRENVLRGMMCADLVGFHTFDYARHFLSCCKRILDLDFETLPGGSLALKYSGRYVSLLVSHVSVESATFATTAKLESVQARAQQIRERHAGRVVMLGLDDLDMVKAPLLKLQAYARFLSTHHEWRDRVCLVQVILPTSCSPAEKKTVRDALFAEAASIRTQFGHEVIEMVECQSSTDLLFNELVALYHSSQVALLSTFWDGLNLSPYEYTASQHPDNPGIMVVSEFMGCSRSLSGVLRVNPWGLEAVSDAIYNALTMSVEERKVLHSRRLHYVLEHTLERWALGFIANLDEATKLCADLVYTPVGFGSNVQMVGLRADFSHADENLITNAYRKCPQRVLLLDYDGTLTAGEKTSTRAKLFPARLKKPSAKVKKYLRILSQDPNNVVFIIAGRQRKVLLEWFSDLPELGLAAEKGCFVRWPASRRHQSRPGTRKMSRVVRAPSFSGNKAFKAMLHERREEKEVKEQKEKEKEEVVVDDEEWECLAPNLEDGLSWKAIAMEVMKAYTDNTDGAWIEDKEFAIVWHYENADPEFGRLQAAELTKYLIKVISSDVADVVKYDYNRIVEIKPHGVGKGSTATYILRHALANAQSTPGQRSPFILCVGDDRSDEDMFRAVHLRNASSSSASSSLSALTSLPLAYLPLPLSSSSSSQQDSKKKEQAIDPNSFTCCVGIKPSCARFYLHDHEDVVRLLQDLAKCTERTLARQLEASSHYADSYGASSPNSVLDSPMGGHASLSSSSSPSSTSVRGGDSPASFAFGSVRTSRFRGAIGGPTIA